MIIFRKKISNCFLLTALFFITVMPNSAIAQIGNTQPPSSNSGVGQNNGSPYNNTSNGGSTSGMSADASGDPGGPTDPPSDVNVPIDGGVTVLLAVGLVHGFLISRRRTKMNIAYATK